MPKGSAEPGPYRASRTPWVKGITEAVAKAFTDYVVAVMGSQMGKTDGVLLNVFGWKMDDDPQPCMYVGPTEKNVVSMSNDRFMKMINSTPSLDKALKKGHANKTAEKFINSIRLGFAWAGSATELASHPNAIVAVDETDRMVATKEGDVNEILDPRMATYDGIIINTSTPLQGDVEREDDEETGLDHWRVADKDDVQSPSWRLWQEGSRHEWAVPCAHCFQYFIPWSGLLVFDDDGTPAHAFRSTYLACPHNGCVIKYKDMDWMNSKGVFVAPRQTIEEYNGEDAAQISDLECGFGHEPVEFGCYLESSEINSVTFWVSGLCSPWRSFGHRTRAIVRSRQSGDLAREQGAVNTGYGELFKPVGDAPAWEIVKELKIRYKKGDIPDKVRVLTAGVDVHKNRLNYVVRGWGVNYESWLIDYGELHGPTKYQEVWDELGDILFFPYTDLAIALMLIDAGYNPLKKGEDDVDNPAEKSPVYRFCYGKNRARPAIGYAYRNQTHSMSLINVDIDGKRIKEGLQLWHLDSDYFKSFIYNRIVWDQEKPGGWFLPEDASDDYCKQLVAESRIVKDNGRAEWRAIRKANHYLDCEMNATAAAHILRLYRITEDTKVEVATEQQQSRRQSRVLHRGIN